MVDLTGVIIDSSVRWWYEFAEEEASFHEAAEAELQTWTVHSWSILFTLQSEQFAANLLFHLTLLVQIRIRWGRIASKCRRVVSPITKRYYAP